MLELQQPVCCPSTFDFDIPLDFSGDQDTLELAALSEDIFSSGDCGLPDLDCLPPLRSAASSCSGKDTCMSMVSLETLHQLPQHNQEGDNVHVSVSPSSSGTSYRPVSEAGLSCASDCTEGEHFDSPPQSARKPVARAGVKVDVRIGKRKPDVDLSTIQDVTERRKQRRLAKNRATAATSRARKREQMSHLTVKVAELEEQIEALTQELATRNRELAAATSIIRPL